SPEESAKARTERLATVLELTPEQKAKVQALHEQQAREAAARMAEMEKKRAEHDAQMKGILTAEQYAKWQAMNEQRKERMHERRKSDASKRQR
ncbi:MAG TPA: hypothetical protein PKY96_18190, partial [Flavobacteriales bacterium]|nr:hypothetical protein [Flavobacteriales bacterium]